MINVVPTQAERNLVGGVNPLEVMQRRVLPDNLKDALTYESFGTESSTEAYYSLVGNTFFCKTSFERWKNQCDPFTNPLNRQPDNLSFYIPAVKISNLARRFTTAIGLVTEMNNDIDEEQAEIIVAHHWDVLALTEVEEEHVRQVVKDFITNCKNSSKRAVLDQYKNDSKLPYMVDVLPLAIIVRLDRIMKQALQKANSMSQRLTKNEFVDNADEIRTEIENVRRIYTKWNTRMQNEEGDLQFSFSRWTRGVPAICKERYSIKERLCDSVKTLALRTYNICMYLLSLPLFLICIRLTDSVTQSRAFTNGFLNRVIAHV